MDSLEYLTSLDGVSLLLVFWYAVVFEVPRYLIGAVVIAGAALFRPGARFADPALTASVLLVGHNEAGALRRCVVGLAEQTIAVDRDRVEVIVVDDGSTDGMAALARELRREGLVDQVLRLDQRGGKSAGVNLALTRCRGDIVIICDIDTTLDRDAIELVMWPFGDPRVGAVCGNLGVRNAFASLVTRHQAIEYLIAISLGRRIDDMLGILSIVSGAFGAFRRVALDAVGGQDPEIGEDADMTLRVRRAGWRIRFAPAARALTDAPVTMPALIAQRLRWDRGLVTIWLRKFKGNLYPGMATFRWIDLFALLDVIVFQIALTLIFPGYILWLWYYFGEFTITVLGATLIGYIALLLVAFVIAAAFNCNLKDTVRLLPFIPLHIVIQICVMRPVRLIALAQEFIFRSSYRDPYVPARVMRRVERV